MFGLLKYIVPLMLLAAAFSGGYLLGSNQESEPTFTFQDRKHYRRMLFDKMASKLDLSEEQRERVDAILLEQRMEFRRLRGEVRPKFEELHQQTRTLIRAELSEDQQQLFDRLVEDMSRRQKEKSSWRSRGALD